MDNGFDIILTIDKNLMYQQNLEKYSITIIVLDTLTSKIKELVLFIPQFIEKIADIEKHKAYLLSK